MPVEQWNESGCVWEEDHGLLDAEQVAKCERADVAEPFARHLSQHGVAITGTTRQRWVTHLDVGRSDVDAALHIAEGFFAA